MGRAHFSFVFLDFLVKNMDHFVVFLKFNIRDDLIDEFIRLRNFHILSDFFEQIFLVFLEGFLNEIVQFLGIKALLLRLDILDQNGKIFLCDIISVIHLLEFSHLKELVVMKYQE